MISGVSLDKQSRFLKSILVVQWQETHQLCAVDFNRNAAVSAQSNEIESGFVVYPPGHDGIPFTESSFDMAPDMFTHLG